MVLCYICKHTLFTLEIIGSRLHTRNVVPQHKRLLKSHDHSLGIKLIKKDEYLVFKC